jgi:DNA topoisomerase-6 subunit B
LAQAKVSAPSSDCLAPIGEASIRASLAAQIDAAFYTAKTRPPAVYRGHPFQIEVGLAWGRPVATPDDHGMRERLAADAPAHVVRLANRVPLLFAPGGCAITQAVLATNWHAYGIEQPRGALPIGPLAIFVHVASVWVPFTSEAKEAIASYPEIEHEILLGLRECGRRLGRFVAAQRRERETQRRHERIERYLPQLGVGMQELLDMEDDERDRLVERLHAIFLERWGESP